MIDSRCGLHCTGCEYKEMCGCGGCIETNGHPFHGECPVAVCCQDKGIVHCGECPEIPCELLTQYSYIVGTRPGYMDEDLLRCMEDLHRRYGTEIIRIDNHQFDISATEIRQRISRGELADDPSGKLLEVIPENVAEYITEHGLYQTAK